MPALAEASLSDAERRVLERTVALLRDELPGLTAIWLYGSRARGETPHEESDVDVMVIADDDNADEVVHQLSWDAATDEGLSPFHFSMRVYSPARLAQRREIRSFFIQEVDRDKIVLYGDP